MFVNLCLRSSLNAKRNNKLDTSNAISNIKKVMLQNQSLNYQSYYYVLLIKNRNI